jgi:hypothetical protein
MSAMHKLNKGATDMEQSVSSVGWYILLANRLQREHFAACNKAVDNILLLTEPHLPELNGINVRAGYRQM